MKRWEFLFINAQFNFVLSQVTRGIPSFVFFGVGCVYAYLSWAQWRGRP